jgi:hypothetical protein
MGASSPESHESSAANQALTVLVCRKPSSDCEQRLAAYTAEGLFKSGVIIGHAVRSSAVWYCTLVDTSHRLTAVISAMVGLSVLMFAAEYEVHV